MITRERWQRIKDLFNSALTQPAAERKKARSGSGLRLLRFLIDAAPDNQEHLNPGIARIVRLTQVSILHNASVFVAAPHAVAMEFDLFGERRSPDASGLG